MEGVDPPRGFAFAWFKISNGNIGVYSLHLKSNLIMRGNKEVETARNIRKREVATQQLLNHLRDTIATAISSIKTVIIGGDFKDQPMFASEKTSGDLRLHHVIRVYDEAGNVIETHEHAGDFK